MLAGFNGVLVSDFYAGYGRAAAGVSNRNALSTLCGDINEEVLKQPAQSGELYLHRPAIWDPSSANRGNHLTDTV